MPIRIVKSNVSSIGHISWYTRVYLVGQEVYHVSQEVYHVSQEVYHVCQEVYHVSQEVYHVSQEVYHVCQEVYSVRVSRACARLYCSLDNNVGVWPVLVECFGGKDGFGSASDEKSVHLWILNQSPETSPETYNEYRSNTKKSSPICRKMTGNRHRESGCVTKLFEWLGWQTLQEPGTA